MFIHDFQKRYGLKVDGDIGKQTLTAIMQVCKIPTKEATAHFVGNTYHETGGFVRFEENLNYSVQELINTWPTRFNKVNAPIYAHRPEAIANKVYANRMGNGNESSGDGWKYRGRGALQTTGKKNYRLFSNFIGIDVVSLPDMVATTYQLESAEFYFDSNGLWKMASVVNDASIKAVRKAVNGGYIGLDDVRNQVYRFYNLIR